MFCSPARISSPSLRDQALEWYYEHNPSALDDLMRAWQIQHTITVTQYIEQVEELLAVKMAELAEIRVEPECLDGSNSERNENLNPVFQNILNSHFEGGK